MAKGYSRELMEAMFYEEEQQQKKQEAEKQKKRIAEQNRYVHFLEKTVEQLGERLSLLEQKQKKQSRILTVLIVLVVILMAFTMTDVLEAWILALA